MELRDYQKRLSSEAKSLLDKYKFVLLSMEVRTGKTFTALATIEKYWAKNVLFLTKKKAISSISDDYEYFKDKFNMTIINYESLHKVEWDFDLIVLDECHQLWTYPKPNNKYKDIKKRFLKTPKILLSGTISPESYSQLYHQFAVHWLFKDYKNFYKWAKDFVTVRQVRTSYWISNDYSNANRAKVIECIKPVLITFTQKEAWFSTEIKEIIEHVEMKSDTYEISTRLIRDKVVEIWDEVILADTMVKEQQKVHQLFSWTIKFESWNTMIVDDSKAKYIKERFKWKKIWIFYNFKAERDMLKQTFWNDICEDLETFNSTDKNIMLQIVSGREWISLRAADNLVFFNIAFSALSYRQARDRLTTMDRKENTIYRIFAKWWLEDKIYKSVMNKKSFTSKLYEEDIKWSQGTRKN